MLRIKLNQNEYDYLQKSLFVLDGGWDCLRNAKFDCTTHVLEITSEKADELREFLGDRLQIAGFDENYELTAEGKILESLIDKCFIG